MQAGVPRIGLVAVGAMAAVLGTSMIAEARVFSGSGKANRVSGTKKADRRGGSPIGRQEAMGWMGVPCAARSMHLWLHLPA